MDTKLRIRISRQDIFSILIILFIFLIAIGAYYETNSYTIGLFCVISIPFFLKKIQYIVANIMQNRRCILWIIYIVIGMVSTFLNGRVGSNNAIFVDLSFLFIALSLSSMVDRKEFLISLKNIIVFIGVIVLLSQLMNIDFFGLIKTGTVYSAIDIFSGGGVSALFEYRHYYGMFINAALLIEIYYHSRKAKYHIFNMFVLVINIILTYTRSTWIAIAFALVLYIWKNKKDKIKSRTVMNLLGSTIILLFVLILVSDIWFPILGNVIDRIVNAQVTSSTYIYGGVRGYVIQVGVRHIIENWNQYLLIGGGHGFALSWLKANPYGLYKEWSAAIDVQYVTVFMNLGVLGIVTIFLFFLFEIKTFLASTNREDEMLSILFIMIGIILIFFDIFDTCTSVYAFWVVLICLRGNKKNNFYRVGKLGDYP